MNRFNDDVYYKLVEVLNLTYTDSSDYTIAKVMLEKYEDLPKLSIESIANDCHLSASSITRFIQKIGYENYKDLKLEIGNQLNIKHLRKGKEMINIQHIIHHQKNLLNFFANEIALLNIYEPVEQLTQLLIQAKSIAIACTTHDFSSAVLLQDVLVRSGKECEVLVSNTSIQKIERIKTQYDFILFTTYTGQWLKRNRQMVKLLTETTSKTAILYQDDKQINLNKYDYHYHVPLPIELPTMRSYLFTFIFDCINRYLLEQTL